MNIKAGFGLAIIYWLMILPAWSQNDFFFNHYMFNPSYYNPAWVGVEDQAFAAAHLRSQWVGFSSSFDGVGGAPASQLVSMVVPWESKISGVGLSISNDQVGNLTDLQVRLSVSASKNFRFGKLSIGLMPTLFSQTIDFSQLRPVEPEPDFPEGQESQIGPDLGAGIYFESTRSYFFGLSVVNLLEPSFDYGIQFSDSVGLINAVDRNYLLTAGTEFVLTRDLVIRPTTLIRSDLNSYTFELSSIAYYKDKMWGGLSFRRSEAVTLLLGYSFLENNQLKFGYSFDYVINDREAKQPTSHEIYIRYNLPDLIFGGGQPVKTPRFPYDTGR